MPAIDHKALARAMDMAGMTPNQLAETLGISPDYMLNIRNGHRGLKRSPALRRQIANALNVPMHWIERPESGAA